MASCLILTFHHTYNISLENSQFNLTLLSGKMFIKVLSLAFVFGTAFGAKCRHPPPAPEFTNAKYSGMWYEIGRIQTAGGSIFQIGAVCTNAKFTPESEIHGNGKIEYSSRLFSPSGLFNNASGNGGKKDFFYQIN